MPARDRDATTWMVDFGPGERLIQGEISTLRGPRFIDERPRRERMVMTGGLRPHRFDRELSPMDEPAMLDVMFERNYMTGQREFFIQPQGSLRSLNREAMAAIKSLFDIQLAPQIDRYDRPREHFPGERHLREFTADVIDGLDRALAEGYDLNQMAADKVLPLFWLAVALNADPHSHRARTGPSQWLKTYSKETAGDVIKIFRDRLGLSKNEWKTLLKRTSAELYWHNRNLAPFNIYFPESVLQCREIGHPVILPDGPMHGWFARRWNSERFRRLHIDPQEFTATIRDLADVMRFNTIYNMPIQDFIEERAHDWRDLVALVRHMENQAQHESMTAREVMQRQQMRLAQMQINPPLLATAAEQNDLARLMRDAMERLQANDVMENINQEYLNAMLYGNGAVRVDNAFGYRALLDEGPIPTAETAKRWKFLDALDWPNEFTFRGSYKAELIATDYRLYQEGTGMRHCIWDRYRNRFAEGKYIAWHIHVPGTGGPGSGYTAGFKPSPFPSKNDQGQIIHAWELDQIRGYSNNLHRDHNIDELAEFLVQIMNGNRPHLIHDLRGKDEQKT